MAAVDRDGVALPAGHGDLARITANLEHATWSALRDTDDARYVGLAMPRFLSRAPYGAKTNPVEAFDFEETTDSAGAKDFTWANAAYAMAVNINRSSPAPLHADR